MRVGHQCRVLSLVVIGSMLIPAMALSYEKKTQTSPVSGHAPILKPVLDNLTPKPDDTVTVSPRFSDEDGDVATSYEYQWFVNGVAIPGATKDHIVVEYNWRGQDLSVRVTGHTDPAISEPSEGTAISGTASVIGSGVTSLVANGVSGASGAANVGFPKTGFVGAKFKIVLNNGNFFTTPYGEWTSNRSWVTVDRNGNVTFTV